MAEEEDERRVIPVILCGGAGTRLWPLSRIDRPKQLVRLGGGRSLLQETAFRTADAEAFAPPIVVTGADEADAVFGQLAEAGCPPGLLIEEPCARGTAAAVALAALAAGEEAMLLVMPSDHAIADLGAFRAAVAHGLAAAAEDSLVTFGVRPQRPETGYGYIRRGEALGTGVFAAAQFSEKPDRATAEAWLAAGDWLWNAGIFLFRSGAFLAALEELAPEILGAARSAISPAASGSRLHPDAARFAAAPVQSIDRAVMERAGRVAVVPVEMGWSDVGSWEALHAMGPADGAGNVVAGDAVAVDSRNCLVRSDGPAVVALGVEDLVIVATERAVLVVPRSQSQRVKEAIDALHARRGEP
ncbi:MAG TPA: sugar phosphate nucleotidyltransferase [Allosphingosinicella sp.]